MWPRPFTWVPAEGHRHASSDPVPPPGREFPPDISVTTLCDRQVTTATGEVAWFWPTCFDCDDRARALVGVAAHDARTPAQSSADRGNAVRNSAACNSAGYSSAEQNDAARNGAERSSAEDSSADQGGSGQDGTQRDRGPRPDGAHPHDGRADSPGAAQRTGNTAGGAA